jgi:hypothetical protein
MLPEEGHQRRLLLERARFWCEMGVGHGGGGVLTDAHDCLNKWGFRVIIDWERDSLRPSDLRSAEAHRWPFWASTPSLSLPRRRLPRHPSLEPPDDRSRRGLHRSANAEQRLDRARLLVVFELGNVSAVESSPKRELFLRSARFLSRLSENVPQHGASVRALPRPSVDYSLH